MKGGATMNAQHTPGPWELGRIRAKIVAVYGPKGTQIADCDSISNLHEENIANARLIAQAPAMLEALEVVEGYLVAIDDENGNEHMYECPGEESCILCQVRETIRKAKGDPEQ
jgi:hypothetical protein